MTTITSRDNPKLRVLRRLAESRGRRRIAEQVAERIGRPLRVDEDLLLLEGPHLIGAGLDVGLEFLQVFCTGVASPVVIGLKARLETLDQRPELFEVDQELLHGAVEAETSQGICALALRSAAPLPSAAAKGRVAALWMDRLRDPGNVGAVLRVAEAAGVGVVALSTQSASWRHPRALRASAGSSLRLPLRADQEWPAFQEELDRAWGARCVWLGLSAHGAPLRAFEPPSSTGDPRPLGIALGSESHGLAAEVEAGCHALAAIEMAAPVESLNVAVAAGIALYLLRDADENA